MNSEMHLDTVIEQVWRCTERARSSEFGDARGGRDQAVRSSPLAAVMIHV